ncbi:MAG: TIGR02757 family protein [Bacteroidetes bacterium]|nr:TIGR02757 family protein [Bacteroidota bacterium]MBM3430119.1 TIGR02757 family protein [Bacteroidota bacterium]
MQKELQEFLIFKSDFYEHPDFIYSDPIQIPKKFSIKEDIEIAAFLIATIAWGNRQSIIKSGEKLMRIMGNSPYDFIMNYNPGKEYDFVHRTFNSKDLAYFFSALKHCYQNGGLEKQFLSSDKNLKNRIIAFRTIFLSLNSEARTIKHVSNPEAGSAAKRLVMFLRWMVRSNAKGVDFGLWKSVSPSELYIPLDVHTGNIARKLGILQRNQNDWKTNEELRNVFLKLDPLDPARFDFALFGLGAFEKF